MPELKEYLKSPMVRMSLIICVLVMILLLYQVAPFVAYGIPAISFHKVFQSRPTVKTEIIGPSSYGSWVILEYSNLAQSEDVNIYNWWGKRVQVELDVRTELKVEITDIASPRFLTEIKPSPFLIQETAEELTFRNITIHTYTYSFKLTLAWSGSVRVAEVKRDVWGLIPPGRPSIEDLAKDAVNMLVTDYNKKCYVAADLLMSIDAPTLGKDVAYLLNPDYVGIFGMWLQDYVIKGYVKATAAEAQPQSLGTTVSLYRDKDLTAKCWAPDYAVGKPLLTPNATYWLQNLAPYGAWWETRIINLGSELVFNERKPYPDYVSWAWEEYGIEAPAIAQWFRLDIGFRVYEDFKVPNIPLYEIPPEEKEKQMIIITVEPENVGTPLTPPEQDIWLLPLEALTPILLIIFVGTFAIIVTYAVIKYKPWRRKET